MGIIVTDNLGMIVDKNPFASELLGIKFGIQKPLIGMKLSEIFGAYSQWMKLVENYATGETEIEITGDNHYYIDVKVYPLHSQQKTPVGAVTIMRDVTDIRMAESILKTKAQTDSMTGLLNKESFMTEFSNRLKESKISKMKLSVLMMDLDKFKGINDTYGHDSGDRILVTFSEVLKNVLRQEDVIARMGGDEFAAILPGADRKKAMEIANRILKIASEKVVWLEAETSVCISTSIGICDNESVETADEMLKFADYAMYQAKNASGNNCVIWEDN